MAVDARSVVDAKTTACERAALAGYRLAEFVNRPFAKRAGASAIVILRTPLIPMLLVLRSANVLHLKL